MTHIIVVHFSFGDLSIIVSHLSLLDPGGLWSMRERWDCL